MGAAKAGAAWSAFELAFAAYFALHVPVTLLIDGQCLLPRQWFPAWAIELVRWHVAVNKDWLVASSPLWFKSFIGAELLFQLPCFFALTYGLLHQRPWARILGVVYGTHAATTCVPIMACILLAKPLGPDSIKLAAIYLPYLLMPLVLTARMALRDYPQAAREQGKAPAPASKLVSLGLRLFDQVTLAFLASHIPITLAYDTQSLVPKHLHRSVFPSWALDTIAWHVKTNDDHLVATNPLWYLALVCCEHAFQLPSFFVLVYALLKQRPWIRFPALIYGSHVTTTMIPILAEFWFSVPGKPKLGAIAIYLPYLLVPLGMVLRYSLFWREGGAQARGRGSKKQI